MKKVCMSLLSCLLMCFSMCDIVTSPVSEPVTIPGSEDDYDSDSFLESNRYPSEEILTRVSVLSERDAGACVITATTSGDTGFIVDNAFRGDGDASLYRTANVNPAVVTMEFSRPLRIGRVRVLLGEPGYPENDANRWRLEAASNVGDLDSKTGTWLELVPDRGEVRGTWDEVALSAPQETVFRFTVRRTVGDDYVHIPELELYELTTPGVTRLTVSKHMLKLWENWNYRNLPAFYDFTVPSGSVISMNASTFTGWSSSNESVVTLSAPQPETGSPSVITHDAGTATVTAFNGPFKVRINVAVRETVSAPVHEVPAGYLSMPRPGALYEIPVIILSFIPTKDGRKIDATWYPDVASLGNRKISVVKSDVVKYSTLIKYAMEEGSRYHGYRDASAPPSLSFRIVDFITIYEPFPPSGFSKMDGNGRVFYGADYDAIFRRFGIREKIENLGVKEIWIWSGGLDSTYPSYDPRIHRPEFFTGTPESNMASPWTGDVSNSSRDPDMPVYSSTYIVYHFNIYRTQTTNTECRTHQLEHMFRHANALRDPSMELFEKLFVGRSGPNGEYVPGRAGWTHMPPNTDIDYGYMHYIQLNLPPVLSDIEDWKPDGSGVKKPIDRHAWEDLEFDWPDGITEFEERFELQWFIYWMQNMPGFGNVLTYKGHAIRNWWEVYAEWENLAKTNSLSLWH